MISGTVNSNILGAASVYAFHIADSVITSAKIGGGQILTTNIGNGEVTGSKIAAGSIGTTQLTNGFALAGSNILAGTIGSANIAAAGIAVTNLTTNTITAAYLATGTLPVATNIASIAIPASGGNVTATHSLAGTPSVIRVVLRCGVGGDAATAYVEGDEIAIHDVTEASGAFYQAFSVSSTATTVRIVRYNGAATLRLLKKDTGALTSVTAEGNFTIKVYLTYIP
jgi:hypothetical protein